MKKKKNCLRFIPRRGEGKKKKSSALAPRREGAPLKAHLLFTLYLHEIVYRRFMLFCFSLFSLSLSPSCSIFLELGFSLCRSSFGPTQMLITELDN